jgi:hypothetical protein
MNKVLFTGYMQIFREVIPIAIKEDPHVVATLSKPHPTTQCVNGRRHSQAMEPHNWRRGIPSYVIPRPPSPLPLLLLPNLKSDDPVTFQIQT